MGRENSDSAQSFSSAVTALECIRVLAPELTKHPPFPQPQRRGLHSSAVSGLRTRSFARPCRRNHTGV